MILGTTSLIEAHEVSLEADCFCKGASNDRFVNNQNLQNDLILDLAE